MSLINCSTCGKEISDTAKVCPHCGAETLLTITKRKKRRKKLTIAGISIFSVGVIVLTVLFGIPSIKKGLERRKQQNQYDDAVRLLSDKKFDEAKTLFESFGDYKDSPEKVLECQYNKALQYYECGSYKEAMIEFEVLGNYKDSTERYQLAKNVYDEERYVQANQLFKDGKKNEAYALFGEIIGYKNSYEMMVAIIISEYKVGNTIQFGKIEQDGNMTNGKESIDWIILDKTGNKVLLLSKYVLDWQQFNSSKTKLPWASCSLREWLNGDFYNSSFDSLEKSMICDTRVSASMNPRYSKTAQGRDTIDKVFLLSADQAKIYSKFTEQPCNATVAATEKRYELLSAGVDAADHVSFFKLDVERGSFEWWTRTLGDSISTVATVHWNPNNKDGMIFYSGETFAFGGTNSSPCYRGVRPAIWIGCED